MWGTKNASNKRSTYFHLDSFVQHHANTIDICMSKQIPRWIEIFLQFSERDKKAGHQMIKVLTEYDIYKLHTKNTLVLGPSKTSYIGT